MQWQNRYKIIIFKSSNPNFLLYYFYFCLNYQKNWMMIILNIILNWPYYADIKFIWSQWSKIMTWCLFNLFHAKSVWKKSYKFNGMSHQALHEIKMKLFSLEFHANHCWQSMCNDTKLSVPFSGLFSDQLFSNTHIIKQIIINIASWYYKYPLNPITAREENLLSQTTVLSLTTLPNRVIIHIKSGREWM